ncbi:hypothetical protein [Actinokineospora iranica]|uniref:Uncharacterized protein n=1 Tax=Actinokineospora iranica TaxID=1271860 RepID=A0A1G6K134_9PSEU|nr:hypothetical protein [Actinokineospora iranica]SDC24684.1 hypothetical protein SAMN05216174_101659 [Actinokineospora iranica]
MGFLLATALAATVVAGFPDPAPLGPQRPFEPDVAGPANIESGEVHVASDGTRHGVEVTFDGRRWTESGEKPAAARRFVFLFDDSVRFATDAFPTCARSVIERHGFDACPAESRVGSGRAEFYPSGVADVVVFNTRYDNGTRGMLITIPATGGIFENTFERVSRPYRDDYAIASDEIMYPNATPPQERPSTSRFTVTFGAVRDGKSFVRTTERPGKPLDFGVYSEYVTGEQTLTRTTATRP